MTRLLAIIAVLAVAMALPAPAHADAAADCFCEDLERRIQGCTALIDRRDQSVDLSYAYAMRALAFSIKGQYDTAIRDYDTAIALKPDFAIALNTRAHIRQSLGDPEGALSDYESGMRYGGARMIKLYQCGLRGSALYSGEIDGVPRPELTEALRKCAHDKACDPLPPGEKCP